MSEFICTFAAFDSDDHRNGLVSTRVTTGDKLKITSEMEAQGGGKE